MVVEISSALSAVFPACSVTSPVSSRESCGKLNEALRSVGSSIGISLVSV